MIAFRILYILMSILLIIRVARRKIDFYSVAAVCLIIYNIYCASGVVWIASHESVNVNYYYGNIDPRVYIIVLLQMVMLYLCIVNNDHNKKTLVFNSNRYSTKLLDQVFTYAGIVSALIMIYNIIKIGPANLTGDKTGIWAQTSTLYVTGLWLAMAVFAYASKNKKRRLLLLSLPQVLIHLFIGSRAYFAVIAIVFLLYYGKELRANFRSNFKIYILGAVLMLGIMLYKQIWLDVKAGDINGIIETLKTPDTYAWIFRWGEPRIVLANFNYIITSGIKLNVKEICARLISIIPFAREFIFESNVNYLMSGIVMSDLNSSYGLASNIWGEFYSMFSYWFVFVMYILWLKLLDYGNEAIQSDSWTSYFIAPLVAYYAYYIHRMDFVKVLGNAKMLFFAMCIWFILLSAVRKKWVLRFRSPRWMKTKSNSLK